MSAYHAFTASSYPDMVALLAAVRAACGDASAGIGGDFPVYRVKKATDWTEQQIAATQAAFDSCPALTPQRQAQNEIDNWPISMKAFVLALIEQINVLRLQAGLSTVTPAQALAAIRNKAGTL
jgi:hypothetical protein